jgi:hypothetical protein
MKYISVTVSQKHWDRSRLLRDDREIAMAAKSPVALALRDAGYEDATVGLASWGSQDYVAWIGGKRYRLGETGSEIEQYYTECSPYEWDYPDILVNLRLEGS